MGHFQSKKLNIKKNAVRKTRHKTKTKKSSTNVLVGGHDNINLASELHTGNKERSDMPGTYDVVAV